eukprot:jgi/Antlo1/350/2134
MSDNKCRRVLCMCILFSLLKCMPVLRPDHGKLSFC